MKRQRPIEFIKHKRKFLLFPRWFKYNGKETFLWFEYIDLKIDTLKGETEYFFDDELIGLDIWAD